MDSQGTALDFFAVAIDANFHERWLCKLHLAERVVGTDRGYQALNTLSGTRLNSKLEDLGSSISVVTM